MQSTLTPSAGVSQPPPSRLCRMRILERLDELAALGDRIGYSPEEDAAHELARGWFEQAGLEVEVDSVGNLIGRIPRLAQDQVCS